jgi:hypothetical protein
VASFAKPFRASQSPSAAADLAFNLKPPRGKVKRRGPFHAGKRRHRGCGVTIAKYRQQACEIRRPASDHSTSHVLDL